MNSRFTHLLAMAFVAAFVATGALAQTPASKEPTPTTIAPQAPLPTVEASALATYKQAVTEAQLLETQFQLAKSQFDLSKASYESAVKDLQAAYGPVSDRVAAERTKVLQAQKLDPDKFNIDVNTGKIVAKPEAFSHPPRYGRTDGRGGS